MRTISTTLDLLSSVAHGRPIIATTIAAHVENFRGFIKSPTTRSAKARAWLELTLADTVFTATSGSKCKNKSNEHVDVWTCPGRAGYAG